MEDRKPRVEAVVSPQAFEDLLKHLLCLVSTDRLSIKLSVLDDDGDGFSVEIDNITPWKYQA